VTAGAGSIIGPVSLVSAQSTVVGRTREERPSRRSRGGRANATELRGDIAMKQHVLNDGGHKPGSHKPWRLETYVTAAVVVAAAALLAVLVYGLMNTGTGTPAWMH
jgi:hypothetical protein